MLVVLLIKGDIKAVFLGGGARLAALEEVPRQECLFLTAQLHSVPFRLCLWSSATPVLPPYWYSTGLRGGGMRYPVGKRSLSPPQGKDTVESRAFLGRGSEMVMMIYEHKSSKLFNQSALF